MPGLYAPDGGVNRLPKKWIAPVGGVNKELKELYGVAGGANRKVFTAGIAIGSLSVGDKVKFGKIYGNPIIWTVAEKNHTGYPANSVTLATSGIIKFLAYDASEPTNPAGDRATYGNDRYDYSNIRQWLNKNSSAGNWYVAQHAYDNDPSGTSSVLNGYNSYTASQGFLYAFTVNEQNALLNTTVISKIFESGAINLTDKIFLASCAELGITSGTQEGTKLSLFNTSSYLVAKATSDAALNDQFGSASGSAYTWWTRSTYGAGNVRCITNSGGVADYGTPRNGNIGLRPACNLSANALVSQDLDTDGCHTFIN